MIKIGLCEMFYNNAFDADRFHPDLFRVLQTTHDEDVVEFRDDIEESAVEYIGINMRDAAKPFLSEVPVDYKIKVDKCWSKGD
jgi:DNA polymerase I-like protein with 3'-5' exonuclease and polymerase domains